MTELEHAARYLVAAVNDEISREMAKVWHEIDRLKTATAEQGAPAKEPEERYFNQRQAAKLLGCSTGFIRKQCAEGNFPKPTRLSTRELRWSRSELLEWAEAQRPEDQTPEASRNETT